MRNEKVLFASMVFLLLSTSPAFAQTKEEIDFVTKTVGRKQTPASTLSFLAGSEQGQRKFTQAITRYEAMLKIYAADPGLGKDCPKYAWGLARKAQCLKALGKDKDAIADSKRAIEIVSDFPPKVYPAEKTYVNDAIDFAASVIGTDAVVKYFKSKRPLRRPTALKPIAASEIADIAERTTKTKATVAAMAKDNPDYYLETLYLANLYTLQKKYAIAEPLFKSVIEWSNKNFAGKDNRSLLVPLSNYGYMLQQSGRVDEARNIAAKLRELDEVITIPGLYRS